VFSLSSCGFARGIYIRAVYIYRFCFFPPVLFEDPPLLDFLSAFFLICLSRPSENKARESARKFKSRALEDERRFKTTARGVFSLPSKKKKILCSRAALFRFFQHPQTT